MDWQQFVEQHSAAFGSAYELLFVQRVLAVVPDLTPEVVSCQVLVKGPQGEPRFLDFGIVEGEHVKIAIEVDGWDKKGRGTGATPQEFAASAERDILIKNAGWLLLRFPNTLVKHKAAQCARHVELILHRQRAIAAALARGSAATSDESLDPGQQDELDELERRRAKAHHELKEEFYATLRENRGMKQVAMWIALIVVAFVGLTVAILYFLGPRTAVSSVQPPPPPPPVSPCESPVVWSRTRACVDSVTTVRGPVVAGRFKEEINGQPTFIDLGMEYPSEAAFSIRIWGSERTRFVSPETAYQGDTVCVTGLVAMVDGRTEVTIADSTAIIRGC